VLRFKLSGLIIIGAIVLTSIFWRRDALVGGLPAVPPASPLLLSIDTNNLELITALQATIASLLERVEVFEAGLSIIGGEAWARLKNKTTGAIISVSEVFHNNSTVVWKNSGVFKLHPGNNLYVVEIKSSSDEIANLVGSRIKLSQ
jgi:hypothetical protein